MFQDCSFRSTEGAQAAATQSGQPPDTAELNDQPNGYTIVLDEHGQGLSGRMETDHIAALWCHFNTNA